MSSTSSRRRLRFAVVPLSATLAALAFPTAASAQAETTIFFEETASAFWAVPHTCPDGSIVEATLLVQPTRDFESPDTEDSDPTTRLQYLAVCSGSSFSWGAPVVPSTITSTENLKSLTASGTGTARDNLGGTHTVSFDVTWTAVGPLETDVQTNASPGFSVNTSTRKEREATATGTVTFDGTLLVNGQNNHPTRPAPFIRNDEERTTRMP